MSVVVYDLLHASAIQSTTRATILFKVLYSLCGMWMSYIYKVGIIIIVCVMFFQWKQFDFNFPYKLLDINSIFVVYVSINVAKTRGILW